MDFTLLRKTIFGLQGRDMQLTGRNKIRRFVICRAAVCLNVVWMAKRSLVQAGHIQQAWGSEKCMWFSSGSLREKYTLAILSVYGKVMLKCVSKIT